MSIILFLFFSHWFVSLFFHTFFLHRFASHKMYTTSPFFEKVFYFATWIAQGSSYLVPRAYAVMHRMHHVHSDTEKDPHSPHFFKDVMGMMMHTRTIYNDFLNNRITVDSEFTKDYLPIWSSLDKFADNPIVRISWGVVYSLVYIWVINAYDLSYFWMLLLPIHFLMGPVQGAIVNWCGHKYGYANFDNGDKSKNSEPWGFFLLGELFQNNHHKFGKSANFAQKWFEIDFTYQVMRFLHLIRVIRITPVN